MNLYEVYEARGILTSSRLSADHHRGVMGFWKGSTNAQFPLLGCLCDFPAVTLVHPMPVGAPPHSARQVPVPAPKADMGWGAAGLIPLSLAKAAPGRRVRPQRHSSRPPHPQSEDAPHPHVAPRCLREKAAQREGVKWGLHSFFPETCRLWGRRLNLEGS